MEPKVSFVIPTYDGDSYLAETLETLRNQSLREIEIIVVDDCSPDFTPELMDHFIKLDDRIKYHRLDQNGGVQEARNYGNKLAKAELICVSDHDDLSTKHRALYSYYFMKNKLDVDCLTSAYWECDVDGDKMKHWDHPPKMDRQTFEGRNFIWFHSSACYRKEDILNMPYRQVDGETDDWTFLDDWTKAGMNFHTTPKVLANCRRLPWSQMQFRRAKQGLEPSYIL